MSASYAAGKEGRNVRTRRLAEDECGRARACWARLSRLIQRRNKGFLARTHSSPASPAPSHGRTRPSLVRDTGEAKSARTETPRGIRGIQGIAKERGRRAGQIIGLARAGSQDRTAHVWAGPTWRSKEEGKPDRSL